MNANTRMTGVWLNGASALAFASCLQLLGCSSNTSTTPGGQTVGGSTGIPPIPTAPTGTSGGVAPTPTTGASGRGVTPTAPTTTGTGGTTVVATGGRPATGTGGAAAVSGGTAVATAGVGGTVAAAGGGAVVTAGAGPSTGASGGGAPPTAAEEVMGCEGQKLLKVPEDESEYGPWPIGTRTVQIPVGGVMMTTEVWYPGKPGSQAGMSEVTYDLRDYLGKNGRTIVPEADNKLMPCKNCFRDLPIDDAHGPYPAVIFVHGLFSIRVANLLANTLWASRGFVVVVADHPGLGLADGAACPDAMGGNLNIDRDVAAEIKALSEATGPLAFLGKSVDITRIGLSGHSTGAGGIAGLGATAGVQVLMPLAPLAPPSPSGAGLKSVLFMTGLADSVTMFGPSETAYNGARAPLKRLVGITGANHMDVTDLCWQKNDKGKNSLEVGLQYNACSGLGFVVGLFMCGTVDGPTSTKSVGYVTAATLEETLHCQDRSKQFSSLKTTFPILGRVDHAP